MACHRGFVESPLPASPIRGRPSPQGACSPKASASAQSPSKPSWLHGDPQPQTSLTAARPTPCREHPPFWKLLFLQPAARNTCHLGVPGKCAWSSLSVLPLLQGPASGGQAQADLPLASFQGRDVYQGIC